MAQSDKSGKQCFDAMYYYQSHRLTPICIARSIMQACNRKQVMRAVCSHTHIHWKLLMYSHTQSVCVQEAYTNTLAIALLPDMQKCQCMYYICWHTYKRTYKHTHTHTHTHTCWRYQGQHVTEITDNFR